MKHKSATASDLAPVEQQKSGWPSPDAENRPSNEPSVRERFRLSRTRNKATSKSSGGINAATTDSPACNTQPTPEFNTAEAN